MLRSLILAVAAAALLGAFPAAASAPAASAPTVSAALLSLESSGALVPALHAQYLAEYVAAKHLLPRLSGTRHNELGAVMANLQAMAAAGELIPSRLAALFLTLQANTAWWNTQPLLNADARVTIPGNNLVWEYYPGQGIEIQWLATFGEANGYYQSGQTTKLTTLLNQVIPLATDRAGGLVWEYLFQFDGGLPPWTSGLTQGTAIQALARAWSRTHNTVYKAAAAAGLGVFETAPPVGVDVPTAAGAHYLEYSFAPHERIINGFIQSLNGLYDYTQLTGDPLGEKLFQAGNAEALVELPTYDTGAWSLYDQTNESNLNYHELLITFLQDLCTRTSASPDPLPTGTTGPGGAGGTTGPTGATGATGPAASGGAIAPGGTTGATGPAGPSDDPDAIYCSEAARFQTDLTTDPVLTFTPAPAKATVKHTSTVAFTLSKLSTVTLTVAGGGPAAYVTSILLGHGRHTLTAPAESSAGAYTVTLSATDLAGNHASTSAPLNVVAAPKGKTASPPTPAR